MSEAIKQEEKFQTLESILQSVVKKYSREAIWLKGQDEFKNHLVNLNDEIANTCGKTPTSISISDIHRVLSEIESKSQKLGLGKIEVHKIEKLYLQYKAASPYLDIASLIYAIAMAIHGKPGPIIRKLFIKSSNKINSTYVASTYIIGQVSISLYSENINLEDISEIQEDPIDKFDPIFKLFNHEHIKDLAKLLDISIDINTPAEESRIKIINELNYIGSNKVKHLYNKAFGENTTTYKTLLFSVCNELKIELTQDTKTEELEEKIIMKVLQDTIKNLSDSEIKDLEKKLKTMDGSLINKEALASGGALAAILGLKATGFGVYLAASSALGALTNGLGISLAFSTYTTMSSLIASVLGPIGIGAAAIGLLASLSIAEPKKMIPAIVYIAMLRRQLQVEELLPEKKSKKWVYILVVSFLLITSIILISQFT